MKANKIFSVIEYNSFFAVRYNPTGEERCMGDGVDTIFSESGDPIRPGDPGFNDLWEQILNMDTRETFDAYFRK